MPTIIALDVSLSMSRVAYTNRDGVEITYSQIAVNGINEFLDYLTKNKSMEFVSLVIYSALYEVVVEFTKDYAQIRTALTKIEHFDKTCLVDVLSACNNILLSAWGSQSYAQVLLISDLGIGFGVNSLKHLLGTLPVDNRPLPFPMQSKLSILGLGNPEDVGFKYGVNMYQQLLDVSKQKGQVFIPRASENHTSLERSIMKMFKIMFDTNYKPFEATLNIGSYFRLESVPISVFPAPRPYVSKDVFGNESVRTVSKRFEVCGYIKIIDIVGSGGSPASLSRNLILARVDATAKKSASELEKMETEMKHFFAKSTGCEDEESSNSTSVTDVTQKESALVLFHGALKLESMVALVLLADDWYGLAYSYADKKKSNLMLSILEPGSNAIPWLGDFRYLRLIQDVPPNEFYGFPVKTDKKSYSSGNLSWLKESALQSDIQKILRQAKKMPEKTSHFYKELNRIRKMAQSLGFDSLVEVLAETFEKEAANFDQQTPNVHPECALQLRHAASELRRNDRELIKKFEAC